MAGPHLRPRDEILFLACTRPALVLGAPIEAVGLNLIATSAAFLGGGSLLYLLVAPVLHAVFRAVCRSDPNAFRVLYLGLTTGGQARNRRIWGGSSTAALTPAPHRVGGLRDA